MTGTTESLDLVRGSGSVFADFGRVDADLRQLTAEIIRALDAQQVTVRKAEARTEIAAADFSRIRNANLSRFTVGRLMTALVKLNQDVSV